MGSPGLAQLLNRVNLMYSLGGVMIAGLMSESQARGKAGGLSPYMALPSVLEIRPSSSGTSLIPHCSDLRHVLVFSHPL